MSDGLTLEKLQEVIDLVYPPLYYGLDKNLERGVIYLCKETDFNPEFIALHPDDFEIVKSKITARRLVPIKDEPKEKSLERALRHLTQRAPDVCPECAGSGKTGSIGLPHECPYCDGTGKRR